MLKEAGGVKKPSIPLKDIVKAKYVVCLECGKKLKTLKTHLRKAHGLMPKEYYARFAWTRKNSHSCVRIILRPGVRWRSREGLGRRSGGLSKSKPSRKSPKPLKREINRVNNPIKAEDKAMGDKGKKDKGKKEAKA